MTLRLISKMKSVSSSATEFIRASIYGNFIYKNKSKTKSWGKLGKMPQSQIFSRR